MTRQGRRWTPLWAAMVLAVAGLTSGWAGAEAIDSRMGAADPPPVLLVPGWFGTARDLAALRIRLLAAGWPPTHVRTVTFRDPVGSNRAHAEELDSIVRELVLVTGAERVDIVAHSMGGLATRWYLAEDQSAPVRRVVFLATPHRGTWSAYLAWGDGRAEMIPESGFLDSLNALPAVPGRVEALTIRTPLDTHVVPGVSASLPGVPDQIVCCPSHEGMLEDPDVFRLVLDFLERSEPE